MFEQNPKSTHNPTAAVAVEEGEVRRLVLDHRAAIVLLLALDNVAGPRHMVVNGEVDPVISRGRAGTLRMPSLRPAPG